MYKHAYKKNSANWKRALHTTPSNFMKNSFLLNYQKILNLNSYFVSIFFTCCNDMFEKTKYWGKLNLFSLYLLCSVHLLFDRVYSNCLIWFEHFYCNIKQLGLDTIAWLFIDCDIVHVVAKNSITTMYN